MVSIPEQNRAALFGGRAGLNSGRNPGAHTGFAARIVIHCHMRNIFAGVAGAASLVLVALSGCSTTEPGTTGDTTNRASTAVPGEVNPDAPDASQQVRTNPGFNF